MAGGGPVNPKFTKAEVQFVGVDHPMLIPFAVLPYNHEVCCLGNDWLLYRWQRSIFSGNGIEVLDSQDNRFFLPQYQRAPAEMIHFPAVSTTGGVKQACSECGVTFVGFEACDNCEQVYYCSKSCKEQHKSNHCIQKQ